MPSASQASCFQQLTRDRRLLRGASWLRIRRHERWRLPASTQWDVVAGAVRRGCVHAYEELIRTGAQGDVFYHDDTTMKILALLEENQRMAAGSKERTGMFTTGVVSLWEGHQIVLFFTGRQHAGENLQDVLKKRAVERGPPIQMCDGSSRNEPEGIETFSANCLAHGRRKFVAVTNSFPGECRYVLEALRQVYKNDDTTRKQEMSPRERLHFHQAHSAEVMADLKRWMEDQLAQKKVEPSSSLGGAFSYMLKRWAKLTLFLRKAGAPLDNNICEQGLKKAILHRKNALFYKTLNGARVGDIFMSLIHTAERVGANPFDYLTELQKHAEQVRSAPQQWMPWNYRETLAALDMATDRWWAHSLPLRSGGRHFPSGARGSLLSRPHAPLSSGVPPSGLWRGRGVDRRPSRLDRDLARTLLNSFPSLLAGLHGRC